MDNLSAFGSPEPEGIDDEDDAGIEAPPEIGTDERRMHVRAYNYWASLLRDRAYPSIEDLDPANIEDFGPNSVLLDFTAGVNNPTIAWLGDGLRGECDIDGDIENVSEVPNRSLLSRLTDHYMQIIANQAPVGFEAEFVNFRDDNTLYRGILMPFSSNDDTIDFIYGVINWKVTADAQTENGLQDDLDEELDAHGPLAKKPVPVWEDGPGHFTPQDKTLSDDEASAPISPLGETIARAEPDTLADYLVVARESAAQASEANSRSREALYVALGRAYDFALTADAEQDDYAELLEDAGITVQDRAPMTPIAKLVFGAEYDKKRLTEFATALSHAKRMELEAGSFAAYLQTRDGGLKSVVAEERAHRRPAKTRAAPVDDFETARDELRAMPIAGFTTLGVEGRDAETDGEEFALLMARRMPDGRYAVLGSVPHDEKLTKQAIRKFVG